CNHRFRSSAQVRVRFTTPFDTAPRSSLRAAPPSSRWPWSVETTKLCYDGRQVGGPEFHRQNQPTSARFLITVFLGSVVHSSNAKDVEEKLNIATIRISIHDVS
uniref:Uncharacterized protein n=1 Tax=Oryza meridionalis TaxID=40149 RepID=A0A0E0E3Z3_9ORYZ